MALQMRLPDLVSLTAGVICGIAISYGVFKLYMKNLSPFRGSHPDAIDDLWQFYMRYQGTQTTRLEQEHRQTGRSVIRLGRNQLSFWDPDAYKEIYAIRKFPKFEQFYAGWQMPYGTQNLFTSADSAIYLNRRRKLMPLLSRQSVIAMRQLFGEQLKIFVTRLQSTAKNGRTVNLFMAFRCLTMDVITLFSFGESAGAMQAPDFNSPVLSTYDSYMKGSCFRFIYPWLVSLLEFLPMQVQPRWLQAYSSMKHLSTDGLKRYRSEGKSSMYPVLFSQHMRADTELTDHEICSDANTLVGAGGDTTGVTLTVGAFYICETPGLQDRLYAELQAAYPESSDMLSATWQDLEKLPLLSACVHESLRMAVPVSSDLPRVVTGGDWCFKQYVIPNGTVVSSNAVAVHFNEDIFPDAEIFRPERWLDENGHFSNKLESWLVSFGKGPRVCPGQSMAIAELYLFMAAFFRLFKADMLLRSNQLKLQEHFVTFPVDHDCPAKLQCRLE